MTIDPTAFRSFAQAATHPHPCPGRPDPDHQAGSALSASPSPDGGHLGAVRQTGSGLAVRVTPAMRAEAGKRLKLMAKPDGPTPVQRVSWSLGVEHPMTDEVVSPSDMRRLAKYARYRASEKGRARTTRYNSGLAGQQANYRESMKRLRARFADFRNRMAQLEQDDPEMFAVVAAAAQ